MLDTYAHVTTQAQRQAANTMGSILSTAVQPVWVGVGIKAKTQKLNIRKSTQKQK